MNSGIHRQINGFKTYLWLHASKGRFSIIHRLICGVKADQHGPLFQIAPCIEIAPLHGGLQLMLHFNLRPPHFVYHLFIATVESGWPFLKITFDWHKIADICFVTVANFIWHIRTWYFCPCWRDAVMSSLRCCTSLFDVRHHTWWDQWPSNIALRDNSISKPFE
jgi:hypothetical protein